jgi:hypothetical protein
MSENLIYAMSTKEKMRLSQFFEYFRASYRDNSSEFHESIDLRFQIVRVLDSLGYCEFDFDNSMVYMCKPSLVLLPGYGLPKVLLVGARIPAFIEKLKKTVKKQDDKAFLHFYSQSHTNIRIPSSIYIEAINKNIIDEISREIGIECYTEIPMSWVLANFSASISTIMNNLTFEERTEPNWKRRIFDLKNLSFFYQEKKEFDGIKLVEYRNPVNQQLRHFLWNNQLAVEVERDWGRYLVLSYNNLNVILYDESTHKIVIPITIPLPSILARSVALCTGRAPINILVNQKKNDFTFFKHYGQIYSGIDPITASMIATKLGQELIKSPFEFDERGILHV